MQSPSYLAELYEHINSTASITPATQIKNYVMNAALTREDGAMPLRVTLDEAQAYLGQEVGVTKWFPITQDRVNRFADASGDFQFVHIDRLRAERESCYGGTIAHGLLILSLLPLFASQGTLKIKGAKSAIIYGMDRLRFTNPVRIGSSIRARFTLLSAEERQQDEVLLRHQVTIEVEGEEKPAMLVDWSVIAVL
jgi:acyl dehydratase